MERGWGDWRISWRSCSTKTVSLLNLSRRPLSLTGPLLRLADSASGTVSPAQSAHFATYSIENKTLVIPLEEQPLYIEDWIGLKTLDEKGGLKLEHCPGAHMDLGGKGGCGERLVMEWVGRGR